MPSTASSQPVPVPAALFLPTSTGLGNPGSPDGLTPLVCARLIATYTRPGELVLDLYGTGTVAHTAQHLARRATTMVTHRDEAHRVRRAVETDQPPCRRATARTLTLAVNQLPAALEAAVGRARLIMVRLPSPDSPRVDLAETARLLAACQTALRADGYLIAAAGSTGPDGRFADHATTIIAAARAAGLLYHQHLPVVLDQLHEPTPGSRALAAQHRPALPQGRHRRQHADLLVFAAPAGDHA